MLNRIMGVFTLKPAIFREIAEDQRATSQAAMIVIVMAIFAAVLGAAYAVCGGQFVRLMGTQYPGTIPGGATPTVLSVVSGAIQTVVTTIIGWLLGSWVIAFVAKTFFNGRTNTGEMLRVFGYAQVFQVLTLIPCVGWLVAAVLSVIGAVIGIREASEVDTTNAILIGVVGVVALVIIYFAIALVFVAFGAVFALVLGAF